MAKSVTFKVVAAVLLVVASVEVWAQATVSHENPIDQAASTPPTQTTKSDNRANRTLKRSIYKALAKHTEIDAGNISVVVKGGMVTLNGIVRNSEDIATVERVTKSVPGVLSVTNKLTVQRAIDD